MQGKNINGPFIDWASDGTAEFLGHWEVKAEAISGGKIQRAAYWIDDMPDWARRAFNTLGNSIDAVRWGKHGMDQIAADVRKILGRAISLHLIAQRGDEWIITPAPATSLMVG